MDGVEFTLSEYQRAGPRCQADRMLMAQAPSSGTLRPLHGYTVTETVPDGFATPVKYCWVTNEADTTPYNAPAEGASIDLEVAPGDHFECWWINIPDQGDGSIHINKFTCPEGYDPYAQGIDPFVDCPVVTNGIEFLLNDADAQVTGQVFDGAVNWTGLSAGTYYVDETEPAGTAAIFIWDCQGNDTPMIQGSPISSGPFLLIELMPGDHIVCNWFNVPEAPDTGTVTVVKYGCSTAVFVSVDDCQIYEGGADFELSVAGTYQWTTASCGTTNGRAHSPSPDWLKGRTRSMRQPASGAMRWRTRPTRMAIWWSTPARRRPSGSTTAMSPSPSCRRPSTRIPELVSRKPARSLQPLRCCPRMGRGCSIPGPGWGSWIRGWSLPSLPVTNRSRSH